MFLHEADGQDDDDDEDENKYSFLAKDLQMGAGNTDFSDPAALLRRQREILARIESHKNEAINRFDPLKILKHKISAQVQGVADQEDVDENTREGSQEEEKKEETK